ncbi:MAG: LytTR family DNA-binding domain-containing protein [Lachnospiraceae bacterium]|nr:LytTR family DNA-binding domain-containing protein [Lachnospiraceae bacterium]
MYSIGICDDTTKDLQVLKKYVESSTEYEKDMQVYCFTSGMELLEAAENRYMDLLILDMQMPGISGFEVAEELRKYNKQTVIGFCSAECVPSPKHFRVQPYRYLMKSEPESAFQETIKELLLEMKRTAIRKHIEVTADGKAILLDVREILYLEKLKYGTEIVLMSESVLYREGMEIHAREKLDELEKELSEEGFAKPHASYLVNLRCVKAVDRLELILENGERLSITRSMRDQFHHEFSKYFTKKYRRGT